MQNIAIEKATKEKLDKLGVARWSKWSCGVSTFDWEYSADEIAYVLEGNVVVQTDTGKVTITKGDLVTFPKGLKCTWHVKEPISKVYTFR